jgi:hypothetical protein
MVICFPLYTFTTSYPTLPYRSDDDDDDDDDYGRCSISYYPPSPPAANTHIHSRLASASASGSLERKEEREFKI